MEEQQKDHTKINSKLKVMKDTLGMDIGWDSWESILVNYLKILIQIGTSFPDYTKTVIVMFKS